ncbi:hypothetical protein HanIR_Chr10g0470931 [Helianthus annuus]|nr:hypothetical protein HanIR_Chr10g0470931 [Helianthus annuus]
MLKTYKISKKIHTLLCFALCKAVLDLASCFLKPNRMFWLLKCLSNFRLNI